jgi:ssRNA-specific RNase YbeY (16S rRNA maturation enzyme)
MLHLAGWSDATPRAAAAMRAIQEKILRRALRGLC